MALFLCSSSSSVSITDGCVSWEVSRLVLLSVALRFHVADSLRSLPHSTDHLDDAGQAQPVRRQAKRGCRFFCLECDLSGLSPSGNLPWQWISQQKNEGILQDPSHTGQATRTLPPSFNSNHIFSGLTFSQSSELRHFIMLYHNMQMPLDSCRISVDISQQGVLFAPELPDRLPCQLIQLDERSCPGLSFWALGFLIETEVIRHS